MKLKQIELAQLILGSNVRGKITNESVKDLCESIKEHGVIQPILVRPQGDKYEVVAGHRRTKASQMAGQTSIPALIEEIEDDVRNEYQIIENLQREDLDAIAESKALDELLASHDLADVAVMVGKTQGYIRRQVSLLKLSKDIQKMVIDGRLSAGHGAVIARLSNKKRQVELVQDIMLEAMSIIQTERELEQYVDDLGSAPFDKAECKECEFNGSKISDLFDKDMEFKSQCFNQPCFEKKRAEHTKSLILKLAEKGIKVVDTGKLGEMKDFIVFDDNKVEQLTAEVFKEQCQKPCDFFSARIDRYGDINYLCLSPKCFKRTRNRITREQKKAAKESKGATGVDVVAKEREQVKQFNRIDNTKRQFYLSIIPGKVTPAQIKRLTIESLLSLESAGGKTIHEMLKPLGLAKKKEQPNWNYKGESLAVKLQKVSDSVLDKLLTLIISRRVKLYSTEFIESLSNEVKVDIKKQFKIDEPYLDRFTKDGLLKLVKELKIKTKGLRLNGKKTELIEDILKSVTKTTPLPKELSK